jgi:RimJ/RimL family protein N-acetyltransferase
MLSDHYPAYGLRLRTPRLELCLPDLDVLAELADVANGGIHDPGDMPFEVPWTDAEPAARGRSVITYNMRTIAAATPSAWALPFAVRFEGRVVGIQEISATEFRVVRETATGSWLGQRYQRQGIGTEMRAAVLALAFEGLDAHYAISGARVENAGSRGVSRRLGYAYDGLVRQLVRGEAVEFHRLRLSRDAWEAHRTVPVTIEGLDACRADLDATGILAVPNSS